VNGCSDELRQFAVVREPYIVWVNAIDDGTKGTVKADIGYGLNLPEYTNDETRHKYGNGQDQ
jgi:hypothetical protein